MTNIHTGFISYLLIFFPVIFFISQSNRVGIPDEQNHAPQKAPCHPQEPSSISMILINTPVFDPRFQLWMPATEKSRPHSQMSNGELFRKCCRLLKFNIIKTTHQLSPQSVSYRRTCDRIQLPLFSISCIFMVPRPSLLFEHSCFNPCILPL